MDKEREDFDHSIISQLRSDAERLHHLEMRLADLEQVRGELLASTNRLSEHLKDYRDGIDEWEWFFENSPEMLCVMSCDGVFSRVNPAFINSLNHGQNEIAGKHFCDLVHPADLVLARRSLKQLNKGSGGVNVELRFADNEGNWHWLSWHFPKLREEESKFYALAQDITQSKQSEQEILYRAMHDKLTGLYNRAAFEERLDEQLALARRNPHKTVALYLIDLDGFKHINDEYGHMAGDELLQQVAGRLKKMQRKGEMACRLGGDEFAFLITGTPDLELAPLAERIMALVAKPIELKTTLARLGCSMGVAVFPGSADTKDALIEQADKAMYSIKKSGKGGYRIYSA